MGTILVTTMDHAMDTPTIEDTRIVPAPAKPRRRHYSENVKQQVEAEVLASHDSLSAIARHHDLNANLLFKWKREQQHRGEPYISQTIFQ